MPSPFPGMDPYIEGQGWEDFHARVIALIAEMLMPHVRPRYVVRVEERVYFEHPAVDRDEFVEPDRVVLERDQEVSLPSRGGTATATPVTVTPVIIPLPVPRRVCEIYLSVRERETEELVTTIEVLSPTNKRVGGEGRAAYLRKRDRILRSSAHLVELDLLRDGSRLPTRRPLPPADYYAFVCREERRPDAEVYFWTIRQPLPSIPIPLAGDDPDVPLDLQAVFTTLYDRAGYDYALNYRAPIKPPMRDEDAEWAAQLMAAQSRASSAPAESNAAGDGGRRRSPLE